MTDFTTIAEAKAALTKADVETAFAAGTPHRIIREGVYWIVSTIDIHGDFSWVPPEGVTSSVASTIDETRVSAIEAQLLQQIEYANTIAISLNDAKLKVDALEGRIDPKSWAESNSYARHFRESINGHVFDIIAIDDTSDMTVNPYSLEGRNHYVYFEGAGEVPWLYEVAHLYQEHQKVFIVTSSKKMRRFIVLAGDGGPTYLASLRTNPSTLPIPDAYRSVGVL